jgi:FkbM family methyltransferase
MMGPHFVRVHFTDGPLTGWDFDCYTAERYFVLGARYEHEITEALAGLLQPADVVYDVGAHAGYSALAFARLSGGGRVFAFEPSPVTFQRLKRNIEANRATTITPVNAGVWDGEGTLRLAEQGSRSRVIPDDAPIEALASDIQLVRLDDFVYRDGHPPATLVKIDVEGDAARCLAGASALLTEHRPRVLLEVHDAAEERESFDSLRRQGYTIRTLDNPKRFPYHALAGATTPVPGPASARLAATRC